MRSKRFLLLFCATLLVAGVLAVCLAPLVVAGGLRLWIARMARQEGLRIDFEKIEAPLLRPVVLHKLQIASQADAPFRVMVEASRVELDLNFAAIFSQSRGRFLRSLSAEAIGLDIRRNPQPSAAPHRFAWRLLEDCQADNFKLAGLKLHVENGDTIVDLHNGTLSGAQIEAGVFSASEITIASPWFRKSFADLRGATSWQESRFTVGALTLMRGLDIDAVSIDLQHIGESRLGLELAMDAFGGKLRARISSEDRGDKRTWDAAGTASEISLAQMSDALDLTDRASGSLHACKFTFRGEATNLREATATIWAEVTGLTWRDRTADTIMIGASLYNRQVQVQQLFVKQRNNQFNLTGESALPQTWSDWLKPDFHGDISASIQDLGDFARLFGASPSDFAGQINISGSVNARERKLGGHLSVSGDSLTLFRAPFESLSVKLGLKESRLEIAPLDLRRKNDSLHGQASLDLAGDHSYSFSFTSSVADAADYAALIPEALQLFQFNGSVDLNWTGNGTEATHSGTFHARGHGLHLLESPVVPFDAEFEGDYSPDYIFFRQFNLSNQHAAFSAFVTVAQDYFQLQTLHLDLNGKPRLQGNIFLPVSLSKLRTQANWLAAVSDDPNVDLDVTLDPTDLAELAGAIITQPKMSGQASGSLAVHGTPPSLEGNSILHLRDFVLGNEPRISADLETRASLGTLSGKVNALARGSDPVNLEASIPLQLEKRESGYVLNTDGPLSGTVNFPSISLRRLPHYISREVFVDGILSGKLAISNSLRQPRVVGDVDLLGGKFASAFSISMHITLAGPTATIGYADLRQNNAYYLARGQVDFRDLSDIAVRVSPGMIGDEWRRLGAPLKQPIFSSTSLEPDDCVSGIELSPIPLPRFPGRSIDAIDFRGSLFVPNWTISLIEQHADDPLATLLRGGFSVRTFPMCPDLQPSGRTLTLGPVDRPFTDGAPSSKVRRQRK
jgi:hypothetical protein